MRYPGFTPGLIAFGATYFAIETSSTMLMSELATAAGVPVATVKYYLREGLLPPGRATGPRRSDYDESHVRRLRLLWMLREVGGVPVATLRRIIEAVDDDVAAAHVRVCRISDALTPELPGPAAGAAPREMVATAMAEVGWDDVRTDSPAVRRLLALMQLLTGEGPLSIEPGTLTYYARLADGLCRTEVGLINRDKDSSDTLEDMVGGEAVFGEILTVLRRLGHEHYHARMSSSDGR